MQYTVDNLLIKPITNDPDLILSVSRQQAGWDYISFQVRRLVAGKKWMFNTGEHELVFIVLLGCFNLMTDKDALAGLDRYSVFSDAGHVVYLPRRTEFTTLAERTGEFAVAWAPTDKDGRTVLIQPAEVEVLVRGHGNSSFQVNALLPPDNTITQRLIVVENLVPGGHWSHYPPHRHDAQLEVSGGGLVLTDLERLSFFKFNRPEGFAFQYIYTAESSPMQKAGNPINAVLRVDHNCAALVPEGYHPLTCAPGYTAYTLNVLAGETNQLATLHDPRHVWIDEIGPQPPTRLPLY